MKKLLLILLCLPMIAFGQNIMDRDYHAIRDGLEKVFDLDKKFPNLIDEKNVRILSP